MAFKQCVMRDANTHLFDIIELIRRLIQLVSVKD